MGARGSALLALAPLSEIQHAAPMSPRLCGLAAAVLVFAADQATKLVMIHDAGAAGPAPIELGQWLDFVLVWNPGISYSLFSAQSTAGWLALLGFTAVALVLLCVWLWRARTLIGAVALGCLIGGAAGNGFDRAVYGKVVDFIHLHFGAFSPFGVNNIADIAIFAGVALLLYEAFFSNASAEQRHQA
jgi:signal peptidase II